MRTLTATVSAFALVVASSAANAAVTVLDTVTADPASQDTLDAMQDQCDTLAAAHDIANGDIWTGEVVLGAVTHVSGPTEVGTHSIADAIGDPVGAGTFTPAHLEILGDPFRNGGSVNMFGIQQSVGGHYSASEYDFLGDFASTYAHGFSCNIYQEVYNAEETIHHNAEGIYVIAGDFGASEDAVRGNCAAFTAQGDNDPQPDWFGDPFHGGNDADPHCMFVGTAAYDEVIPESWDPPVLTGNEAGTPVNQDQLDEGLLAHEDFGEGFDTSETLLIGQVVVCISPSKTGPKGAPGTWTKQNGYTGDKCTTIWYNGGATVGVPNLNDGSHNWVTVPLV
jgi:hypothetical protein